MKNIFLKNVLLWLVIAIILAIVFNNFGPQNKISQKISYSQFVSDVSNGKVAEVTIANLNITGQYSDTGQQFNTYMPIVDINLLPLLLKNNVQVIGKAPKQRGLLMQIFISWFPMLLFLGIWFYILRQQLGGGKGGAFSFGKSRAKLLQENKITITFDNVAGCEEAKEQVSEIVEFLRNPEKYNDIGGKIPRGILLVGPPGTGKTLLARAVAGESKVPFFSISGSDFVEMFVGVGASRVRDMFEQAKKQQPCIIFIDELDAVGRHRGAGVGGGHDEREQTLNQMLVEMDGFDNLSSVIVIAATNRPDVLDPALLRPGRFDRQVTVPLPDLLGREKILQVHAKNIKIKDDTNIIDIARGTPGFSGADLANLINEAALGAVKKNKKIVSIVDLEEAKDKILMGPEKRTMVMQKREIKLTAYHESGHAIIGILIGDHDPVYKVTIIPRGRALGVTMFLPDEDKYSYSKKYLFNKLVALLGGRVAEEMIFGKEYITTGASNDIQKVTEIARNMITKWGLSESLSPLRYDDSNDGEIFLGQSMTKSHKDISEKTTEIIDKEIADLANKALELARDILKTNVDKLHIMANALIKYETLDKQQINEIMTDKKITPPQHFIEKNIQKETTIITEEKPFIINETNTKDDNQDDNKENNKKDSKDGNKENNKKE